MYTVYAWLIYCILAFSCLQLMTILLLRFLACLPLRLLHAIGRGVGTLMYWCSPKFARRLRMNAQQAGYMEPTFYRRSAAQVGAMIFETPKVWLRPDFALSHVQVANPELLAQMREQHKSIVFVTPHVGCFEICARYLSQQKPIVVMYRPPRRSFVEPAMKLSRDLPNLLSVPAGFTGVREFIKTLRSDGDIGLLPDQVASTADGVWVPYFGRLAFTVTLPGKLALQTGAKIVMVAGERLPRGEGWRLHFREGPELDGLAVEYQAAAMNAAMEELVRLMPEQYLWNYNRYKMPKCAPDPWYMTWPPREKDMVANRSKNWEQEHAEEHARRRAQEHAQKQAEQ